MESSAPVYTDNIGLVGAKSGDPFPMLNNVWDIFSTKGIRTVYLSVGNSKSAITDLEIAEGLGSPINIVPLSASEAAEWVEVGKIVKERKRDASGSLAFSDGAESKWILPKNIRLQEALPWWANGTIDLSGYTLKTQEANAMLSSIAATMKLKDNAVRIDILKIDTVASAPGLEKDIIYALLNAGFRPAIILVKWSEMPDTHLSTSTVAGHLQNTGYVLMSKLDNKFLYYFTDQDMYQTCSWEDTASVNPMVKELMDNIINNFKQNLQNSRAQQKPSSL
jgi:hypothetical protein